MTDDQQLHDKEREAMMAKPNAPTVEECLALMRMLDDSCHYDIRACCGFDGYGEWCAALGIEPDYD